MPLADREFDAPVVQRASVAVADALRAGIIRGDFAPGETVLEESIAVALGVSRTPVREALLLLAGEQLVDLGMTRGRRAIVRVMPKRELAEIYAMRSILEGYVARQAAASSTPALLARLSRSIERMSANSSIVSELIEENDRFHAEILSAVSTSRLTFVVRNLLQIPYEYKRTFWAVPEFVQVDIEGHREILTAFRRSDPAEAEAAMARHLKDVGALVLQSLD